MDETPPRDAWIEMVSAEELAGRMAAAPSSRSLYTLAVMGGGGAFSRQEKEMVAAVAAAAQDCHY